jgi:hypothetical protein
MGAGVAGLKHKNRVRSAESEEIGLSRRPASRPEQPTTKVGQPDSVTDFCPTFISKTRRKVGQPDSVTDFCPTSRLHPSSSRRGGQREIAELTGLTPTDPMEIPSDTGSQYC